MCLSVYISDLNMMSYFKIFTSCCSYRNKTKEFRSRHHSLHPVFVLLVNSASLCHISLVVLVLFVELYQIFTGLDFGLVYAADIKHLQIPVENK